MTPAQLNTILQGIIDRAEDELLNATRKHQRDVVKLLVRFINRPRSGLIVDEQGRIAIRGADGRENRKRLAAAKNEARKAAQARVFQEAIRSYTETYAQVEAEYFEFYKEVAGYTRESIRALARAAAERVRSVLSSGVVNELLKPVEGVLDRSLEAVQLDTLEDELEAINTETTTRNRTIIVNRRGPLERYINSEVLANGNQTKVRDSLHGFSGSVATAAQSQTGAEWIYYGGPTDRKTRDFCDERVRGYYHISEVYSWQGLVWDGKNPAYNPDNALVIRGGYNCRHKWIPVPLGVVPKKWVDRAIRLGFFSE